MISNAAIAVINETGIEGTRLRDVARAADVTTGAVMHYFDDKDAVLEAALEEIVRRTLERMEVGHGPRLLDATAFIERVCRHLPVEAESREEWRVWLAFWGRAISHERLRAVHRRHYGAIVDRLMVTLRSLPAVAARHSRRELRGCADAVIAAIDGVGTRATLEPELWPPRRQRETLVQLLRPMLAAFTRTDAA